MGRPLTIREDGQAVEAPLIGTSTANPEHPFMTLRDIEIYNAAELMPSVGEESIDWIAASRKVAWTRSPARPASSDPGPPASLTNAGGSPFCQPIPTGGRGSAEPLAHDHEHCPAGACGRSGPCLAAVPGRGLSSGCWASLMSRMATFTPSAPMPPRPLANGWWRRDSIPGDLSGDDRCGHLTRVPTRCHRIRPSEVVR